MPELEAIKGELKTINTKINGLDKRIESLRNEMVARFKSVNTRIEEMDKRLTAKIGDLENGLNVVERLAVIEAKLKEYDEALKKLTA